MFNIHNFPVNIDKKDFTLSISEKEGNYLYKRNCMGEIVKKIVITENKKLLINPIEPLNTPKHLTPYLFIEFETPLMIEPNCRKSIFLTFPIEVGIYVFKKKSFHIIDIFTLSRQKFTLYGNPGTGLICKYWKSALYQSIPTTNPLQEGVMELFISNPNSEWFEIKKAIFNAYGMKIYFNTKKVSLKAHIRLKNGNLAETDFEDAPIEKGMEKALESFPAKRLSIGQNKLIMEFGL